MYFDGTAGLNLKQPTEIKDNSLTNEQETVRQSTNLSGVQEEMGPSKVTALRHSKAYHLADYLIKPKL